jgi:hypothetical protein
MSITVSMDLSCIRLSGSIINNKNIVKIVE